MSSGNPMGLSEISHFGTFQRVGGKAGGFISKKFFHPSSFRNQEKLWKAQTADEREKRKQMELEKRRDEERQVEELRKQMYLAGQGRASDFITSSESGVAATEASAGPKSDQRQAVEEQRRRMAMLKRERQARLAKEAAKEEASPASGEEDEEGEAEAGKSAASSSGAKQREGEDRLLAKSKYREDVHILGHTQVWGSWYSMDAKEWGFKCCQVQSKAEVCPHAPDPVAAEAQAKELQARKGKKRKKGQEAQEQEEEQGGLMIEGKAAAGRSTGKPKGEIDPKSFMDTKMLAAAKRRKEQKQREPEAKEQEKAKASGYLTDLLQEPSASS